MIAIIANPNALRFKNDELKWIKGELEKNDQIVDIFFTQKSLDGVDITNRIGGKYDIIAAYGGDGIVNEIINGNLNGSALAVLPAGTTNVLAIELFGKVSIEAALRAITGKKTRKAYYGTINSRRFILMAGAGFDAESCLKVNERLKKQLGKLEYVFAGIKAYLSTSGCFSIDVEGSTYKTLWAIVSNARKYAGNFNISKETDIFTPTFDVLIFPCIDRIFGLPYSNGILFGGLHKFAPLVKHITTDKPITISGKPHIQIDGDYMGKTDARIELAGVLDIVVP